ncbi:MAG: hypothetical protein KF893_21105 [Caldilineaceae bacterium]|nr:hypothetical protein [Caldilineaceae bacterium]
MVEITIQVPDALAKHLEPVQERLPDLLAQLIADAQLGSTLGEILSQPVSVESAPAYVEILDFLASGPEPEEIINFRVSPEAQERVSQLLEKNRESVLTQSENAELDLYVEIDQLMTLLKVRSRMHSSR